jgi:hypothetical protein
MGRALLYYLLLNAFVQLNAQDSVLVRVHFLHGSKPKKEFRHTEKRWFGGVLGGHVGIEHEPNRVLNFEPVKRVHVFSRRKHINSKFSVHDTVAFYQIMGACDTVKRTIVTMKISAAQKAKLDSVATAYSSSTPFDYAFFGMRCSAAAYYVLVGAGVLKQTSFSKTWRMIFYPKRLRRKLESKNYGRVHSIFKTPGSLRRRWEKD